MKTPKVIAAVAWYRAEDWPRWKSISEDGMDDTYEEWLKEVRQAVLNMSLEGMEVHRVIVDPDAFLEWARSKRKPITSSSRSEYAVMTFQTEQPQS